MEPLASAPDPEHLDLWLLEGDGDRYWIESAELPEARPEGAEPLSVEEDRAHASTPAAQTASAVTGAAAVAAGAVVQTASGLVFGLYLLLCAAVPLLAYPALLPSLLRMGDWGATLFTVGLLAAVGLLPLALVWRKVGRRGGLIVLAVHVAGLLAGVGRHWLSGGR